MPLYRVRPLGNNGHWQPVRARSLAVVTASYPNFQIVTEEDYERLGLGNRPVVQRVDGINPVYEAFYEQFHTELKASYKAKPTQEEPEDASLRRAPKGYVIDFKGKTVRKTDAIKINSNWYLKGTDAVEIDGTWVIYSPGIIAQDHFTKKFLFKRDSLKSIAVINGVVTSIEFAYPDSPEAVKAVVTINALGENVGIYPSKEKAIEDGYIYNSFSGIYYHKDTKKGYIPQKAQDCQFDNLSYSHKRLEESSRNKDSVFQKLVKTYNRKYGTDSATDIMTERKGYTFGVELETAYGKLALKDLVDYNLNTKVLRDGSCTGGEYVTGVLYGDEGFAALKRLCFRLNQNHAVDERCGVHVHIGGASFTKDFSVFLYLLGVLIENDVYSILPAGRKANLYCNPLAKHWIPGDKLRKLVDHTNREDYDTAIDSIYETLYKYLIGNSKSITRMSAEDNRRRSHPGGHYAGRGHGDGARYHWLNFVTANFMQHREALDAAREDSLLATVKELLRDYVSANYLNMAIARTGRGHSDTATLMKAVRKKSTPEMEYLFELKDELEKSSKKSETRKKIDYKDFLTVEFRNHAGTINYTKVKNWTLLCMAIVFFAENKQGRILDCLRNNKPITLEEVVGAAYSTKKALMLNQYVQLRRNKFKSQSGEGENSLKIQTNELNKFDLKTVVTEEN